MLETCNLPIKINISDNAWLYTKIATLVDRDEFLEAVAISRIALGQDRLVPYEFFHNPNQENGVVPSLEGAMDYFPGWQPSKRYPYIEFALHGEMANLCREYEVTKRSFHNVIIFSILCGEVGECDYNKENTYFLRKLEIEEGRCFSLDFAESVIVINPYSTKKEVVKAFSQYLKLLQHKETHFPKKYCTSHDTVNSIKRDREWYWMNKRGSSAAKILKKISEKYGNEPCPFTVESIEAQIKQYKKRLRSPFSPPWKVPVG